MCACMYARVAELFAQSRTRLTGSESIQCEDIIGGVCNHSQSAPEVVKREVNDSIVHR